MSVSCEEPRTDESTSAASVTALELSALCIDVREAHSLQEQEPRSPPDEWCSAAVVMATAEQKGGGGEGRVLREERKWHKKRECGKEGIIKGT